MGKREWWLGDAEALHAASPRTFFIPPREHRARLRVGDVAKLLFEFPPREVGGSRRNGERMWVEVVERRPDGTFVGTLANEPAVLAELRLGDVVEFGPEHVITLEYSRDELGYDPAEWAYVDARVRAEDRPPDALVFAPPAPNAPPAWFVTIGRARPEDTMTLAELTDRWPELAAVFRSDGGVWERVDGTTEYRRVRGD